MMIYVNFIIFLNQILFYNLTMKLFEWIKEEFKNFGKYERFLFPLVILLIVVISIIIGDNKIALVSAICGISYTILAGKGKVSCYFIGIVGTFCYSYLSFINMFWGNLCLYLFYYLPMFLELLKNYLLKKTHAPQGSLQHCLQSPGHGSKLKVQQRRSG